jgi:hypothetical protein
VSFCNNTWALHALYIRHEKIFLRNESEVVAEAIKIVINVGDYAVAYFEIIFLICELEENSRREVADYDT